MARVKAAPTLSKADRDSVLKRLASYLFEHKTWMALAILSGAAGVALTVLSPKVLGKGTNILFSGLMSEELVKAGFRPGTPKPLIIKLMDAHGMGKIAGMVNSMNINLKQGMDWTAFAHVLVWVTVIYLAASLLRLWENYLLSKIVTEAVYRMRQEIEHKINHLPLAYFDRVPRGQIMSTTVNDVDNITSSLQQVLGQMLFSVFMLVGVIVMMLTISGGLTLLSLVSIPLILVATRVIVKKSQPSFAAQWDATGVMDSDVEETFSGVGVVRAYGQQENCARRFAGENDRFYQASFRAQALSGSINPVGSFLGNLVFVAVVIVGGLQVMHGTLSLGNFQAFAQYTRQAQRPVSQLASMSTNLQSALASAKRVFDFLDAREEDPDPAEPLVIPARADGHIDGHVRFDSVRFSYDPKEPLIEDLSIEAKPGQMIAIVGPTGAGKTTIINLLMRFYEIQGGSISVDGVDTAAVTRHELRSHFGMVLQDTWLFNGTVRENLLYGLKPGQEITEERFLEGAKATHVDDFVRHLPQGYDTPIDTDSSSLSQGERQLLTICRAFLSDPDILILDEATSSVDTRTEMLVQQAMNTLREGRTSFVIAHRLSTIRDADCILVVNHGSIVEQGTHDELLARGGAYAKLYDSQFENGAEAD